MSYEYPTVKYEYDHNDKMYFIKNKQVHIVCTLNHKLYTKLRHSKSYQLIEAQNVMGKMAQMQKTMKNTFKDVEHIVLENKKYNTNNFLKILGMFIADGSCDSSNISFDAPIDAFLEGNFRPSSKMKSHCSLVNLLLK